MADTLNDLISAGVRSSFELDTAFTRLLMDEASPIGHPALFKLPSPTRGKITRHEVWDHGSTAMVAATEGTDGSVTNFSPTYLSVTCAPYQLIRQTSDGARATDGSGALSIDALALDAFTSWGRRLMSLVGSTVVAGYTATKGTSGSQLTIDDVIDAEAALSAAGVDGRLLCILNPLQFAPIRKELLTNGGGALQMMAEGQALAKPLAAMGYQGSLGRIDFFTTNRITVSSGDYTGALLGEKALVWSDMAVVTDPGVYSLVIADRVKLEWGRKGERLMTNAMSSAWLGAAKGIDARGCSLVGTA